MLDLTDKQQQQLMHFNIIRQIGEGGMGTVYLAHDKRLNRDVALKFVKQDPIVSDDSATRDLISEARSLSRLDHPGICRVIDYLPESQCLVMAFVTGPTLRECLSEGMLSPTQSLQIAQDLVSAIKHIHQSGLVHGDIKPSNIILRDDRPVIVDFGLASRPDTDESTLSGIQHADSVMGGTIAYSAPELFLGESMSMQSDLFSLGCVLHELFTGTHPFSAKSRGAVIQNILNRAVSSDNLNLTKIPVHWQQIIISCLEKQPASRGRHLQQTPEPGVPLSQQTLQRPDSEGPASALQGGLIVALGVLIILTITAVLNSRLMDSPATQEVSDAVIPPQASADTIRVSLQLDDAQTSGDPDVSGMVINTVLDGLLHMKHVTVSLQYQPDKTVTRPEQDVDELLFIRQQLTDQGSTVLLVRTSVPEGDVIATDAIPLLTESHGNTNTSPRDRRMLLSRLFTLYSSNSPLPAHAGRNLDAEKEAVYRDLFMQLQTGNADREQILQLLLSLGLDTASAAIDMMVVDLSRDLYRDTQDNQMLRYAESALERLKLYYPNKHELIYRQALLHLDNNSVDLAHSEYTRLTAIAAGSFEAHDLFSRLQERRGQMKSALSEAQLATRIRPYWGTQLRQARLATRIGEFETAREAIEAILVRYPENTMAQSELGLIELLGGSLSRAEAIFSKLLTVKRHRSYYVNLGLVYMLDGDYSRARSRFLAASELAPGNRVVKLNLADSEHALGNFSRAHQLYADILIEWQPDQDYDAYRTLLYSQCLARLGRFPEALELLQQELASAQADGEIAYQASLIYALAGEEHSALIYRNKAEELGIDTRWFRLIPEDTMAYEPH